MQVLAEASAPLQVVVVELEGEDWADKAAVEVLAILLLQHRQNYKVSYQTSGV